MLTTALFLWLAAAPSTLAAARGGFVTKTDGTSDISELVVPPGGEKVEYPAAPGKLRGWLVKPQGASAAKKTGAMVWLTGGFPPGGMDKTTWEHADAANDQTARQYLDAGLVLFFPTFRGTAGNPGTQDSFFGEVDDVAAAVAYVKTLDFVDPQRVWLGGHSTGATLALLAAEAQVKARGVIAFGAAHDVCTYGQGQLRFDVVKPRECELRSPVKWLDGITVPTWLIEGEGGNAASLTKLREANKNPKVAFALVAGAGHFDVLAPVNAAVAKQLAAGDLAPAAKVPQEAFDARPNVTVKDDDGWTVTLPPGFSLRAGSNPNERVFTKGPLVVGLMKLTGPIGRDCGDALKTKKGLTPLHEKWGTLDICGMKLMQKSKGGADVPVIVFEVPMAPRALNLQVTGAGLSDEELLGFARDVLGRMTGSTSWK